MHKLHGNGVVQSVLLKKEYFKTPSQARGYAKASGYSGEKVDETVDYFRVRQMDPTELEKAGFRFRTVPLGDKGYLVLAYKGAQRKSKK